MKDRDPDLAAELEALKARVRELSQAHERSAGITQPEDPDESIGETASVANLDFDELVDLLRHEVEDLNPLTCLAIFALGVLTGRLLAS